MRLPGHLQRRLDKLQAEAAASASPLADRILAARARPRWPAYTRGQLEYLGHIEGVTGQIARGCLRASYVADTETHDIESFDAEEELVQLAGRAYRDPLLFVMTTFDWGAPGLDLVRLPEDEELYDSTHGPDQWVCDLFNDIRNAVAAGHNEPIRAAIASGHGIGKSAATAWLVLWIMCTRPHARGVVTANTAAQLESKTWAQVATWLRRSPFASWFEIATGRGSMKLSAKCAPESWRCDALTAREETSESFAGLHAADSSAFMIFDEASAIPNAIWQVAEGAMTDGEPFWFAFGNPTRNSGAFFDAFHSQSHRWRTRQVDSRDAQLPNKDLMAQWIADYGLDSDFVKVRVRGMFPTASSLQFIPRDLVDQAMSREATATRGEPIVIGVDVARFGSDQSVIYTRHGRDARTFPIQKFSGLDTMQLASRVAQHANWLRSAGHRVMINVDGGGVGGGVVDRLRQMGFVPNEVQFGSRASDPTRYANKRAEVWGNLREWLAIGSIPNEPDLLAELTAVEYGYNAASALLLESKDSMRSRGLASPDIADALAITLALPVANFEPLDEDFSSNERERVLSFDPLVEHFGRAR